MSHPSISEAFITCIFSLKVNLGQLGIHEWNTVALEGFHIHQCPGLFGMCSFLFCSSIVVGVLDKILIIQFFFLSFPVAQRY